MAQNHDEEADIDDKRPEVPPPITRFSEMLPARDKFRWWAPGGLMFAFVFTVLLFTIFFAFSPLVLILIMIRECIFAGVKYRRKPSDVRIAIIGGGWGGLQCLSELKDLGAENVALFERYSDIGGTWNINMRYHGVQLHAPSWLTNFKDFPYSQETDIQDGKLDGVVVEDYIQKYVQAKDLRPNISCNSGVSSILYDSKSKQGILTVTDSATGEERKEGPFDQIIWASMAAYGKLPSIEGADTFKGRQYHTTEFHAEQYDEVVRSKSRVVVVGGGKAGCDMALLFKRGGYDFHFQWIMRKPYLFWRYEYAMHDRSIINMCRGFSTVAAMLWSPVSTTIMGLMMWGNGTAWSNGSCHNDWRKNTLGVMCPIQRHDLSGVAYTTGNPVRLTSTGLILEDGAAVDCDVIIWATGNESGLNRLKLVKDGQPFTLDPVNNLYNHFVVSRFPVLTSATNFFLQFGPLRGVNVAEMAMYTVAVESEKAEEEMERSARRMLATNNPVSAFAWSSKICTIREFVLVHTDLMMRGIIPLHWDMMLLIEIFVLGKQKPLQLRILPKKSA